MYDLVLPHNIFDFLLFLRLDAFLISLVSSDLTHEHNNMTRNQPKVHD